MIEPEIDFVGEPVLTEALKIGYNQKLNNPGRLQHQPNVLESEMAHAEINQLRGDFVYVKISSWEGHYQLYLVRNFNNFEEVELNY